MQTTEISCPHCGSTLTFGQEVAAGAAMPCLICGQSVITPGTAAPPPAAPTEAPTTVAAIEPEPPPVAPPPVPVALTPPAAGGANAANAANAADAPAMKTLGTRTLVVGGLVMAGLALLVVGGLGLILVNLFPGRTARGEVPRAPSPAAVAETLPPALPGEAGTAPPAAPAAPSAPAAGREIDLADVGGPEKTTPPDPLTAPHPKPAGEHAAPPTVPVIIPGGNPGGPEAPRVNDAIARGVRYLKEQQARDGSWPGGPVIGYTAIAGLTLLECQVPADDPAVVRAANFIRGHVADLNRTYELSLAILFLDRLGSPRDRTLIQGMALRLLAGQNDAGGWTYVCPLLTPPEMHQLLVFLQSHRPALPKAIAPRAELPKLAKTPEVMPKAAGPKSDDPFQQLAELMLPKTIQGGDPTLPRTGPDDQGDPPAKSLGSPDGGTKPPTANKPITDKPGAPDLTKPDAAKDKGKGDKADPAAADKARAKKVTPINPNRLPPRLQHLPVVELNGNKGKMRVRRGAAGDHSNTQFALLALWAARRHDVPTEYALKAAYQRFFFCQNGDGGWGYHIGMPTKDTMTCVGLLGLAMGHGALPEAGKDKGGKLESPQIAAGLRALGGHVGTPLPDPDARPPMRNLYLLWSVERVAVLYDLKTIGGKDWYRWGAQVLVANQQPAGHWAGGQYHGSAAHTDTCFALLFLKRSNLVPDLTENLRLYMVIRDPDGK